MIRKNAFLFTFTCTSFLLFGNGNEHRYSQQEYIQEWKEEAVQQMVKYKIPASITLAQGILESAYGNSTLAREANNHFGIKCATWKGETFYKDDDSKNECFRKYSSARESYEDHSVFLSSKTRYASLFEYEITDYKSWANGLKTAGYATSTTYPKQLIDIIEKYELFKLDGATNQQEDFKKPIEQLVESKKREINLHKNNIQYIVAKKGDTFYRIAKELNMNINDLYKYNEFGPKKDVLVPGDIVYIQSLKNKAVKEYVLELKKDMTITEIAHQEGIKVKRLMRYNDISSPEMLVKKGEKIKLK